MIETPMYQGVIPQSQTEPRMIKLDDVGEQAGREAAGRAVGAVDLVEQTFDYMMDYNTARNTEQQLSEATSEYDKAVKESAALESGHPDSLWNDDGTMREERMAELRNEYEQRVNAINPRFIDSRRGFETGEQIEAVHSKTIERSEAFTHGLKLKKAREGVMERYENYMARGEMGAAMQELDSGVRAGLLSKVKADTMKIQLAKRGAKGRGGSGTVSAGDLTDAMLGSLVEAKKEDAAEGKKEKKGVDVSVGDDGRPEVSKAEAADGGGLTRMDVGADESEDVTLQGAPDGELGKVEGGSLTQVGLAGERRAESLEELLRPTEEDLTLGRDPWDKPEVLKVGFGAMTPDEVEEQWLRLGTEAGRVRAVAADDGVGRMRLEIPEAAEEPMAAVAQGANARGGMTLENYRNGAYATMCAVMTNRDFDGLSDEDMKKLMVGRVEIEGLEEQLFPDLKGEDRGPAMEALVNGIADRVMSTRGDNIRKRVDEFFAGAEGLPGATAVVAGLDEASIGGLYEATEAEQALMNYSWWDKLKTGESQRAIADRIAPLLGKYRGRYEAETGEELGENYGKFRDWYAERIMPERVAAYVEEAKWVCQQAAIDAVVEYRRQGGESWAEENEKMLDAIAKARKSLKGGGDIAAWREGRDAGLAARAAKYREEAEDYAPMLEAAKKESEGRKAEKEAEKERKAYEEGKRKEAQRKVWDAELEAQAREAEPYRYPVVAKVRYAEGDKGEAAVTVPPEVYMKMLQDLKVGRGEGVVCTFGNGKKQVAVKPGKVKGVRVNRAVIQLLYAGRKLKKEQLRAIVNEHNEELHFKKVIKGSIKL